MCDNIKFRAIEEDLTGKYIITDGAIILNTAMLADKTSVTCPIVFYSKPFAEKFLQEFLSDKPNDQWAQSAVIACIESCVGIRKAYLYVDIGKEFDGFTIDDCDGLCSDCDYYSECGGEMAQLKYGI
jgi:hypothetical protein